MDAPRPRAKKAKADPREKELAALIRKRDATSNLSEYTALNTEIKALRAELKPQPRPAAAAARKAAPVQPAVTQWHRSCLCAQIQTCFASWRGRCPKEGGGAGGSPSDLRMVAAS